MKRSFIITLAAVLLTLVSCVDTSIDPLTGIFPDAQEPVLTNLVSSTFEKTDKNRVFTLKFEGSGASVEAVLIGARNQYFLEPNVYGPGESNGCFVEGLTTINGNAVVSGSITVQKKDNDIYKFLFVLFDRNGTAYRTKWEGVLVYEPDPEPVALTKVLIAQKNDNGTVTFKLGTADMDIDMMGTPAGDGFALTADIYSADGYLAEGVYTAASSSENVGPGQYAPGYEYDLSAWGMGIMHWGTCWWAGSNVTHISKEPITVEKKGAKFVITWGSEATYPNWATFTGEIPELVPGDVPNPDYSYTDELSDAVDESFAPVAGVKTHNLTFKNAEGVECVWFQLVLTEGATDFSGEYVCKEYAHEDHTFGNGYDLSMWGMGMGGTRYVAADGNLVMVQPGETLTVTQVGDATYKFVGSTGYAFVGIFE